LEVFIRNSTRPWRDFTNTKAKPFSAPTGLKSPRGRAVFTPNEAMAAAKEILHEKDGEVVIKIQA
jgi:hypothetical protein